MKKIKWLTLIICIVLPNLAGLIGSVFTSSSVSTWYTTLVKPSFNPPGWVFGPVWTTLYILMGISLYLIWTNKKRTNIALWMYGIQLVLNALWSFLFFGLRNPLAAFIEIIILWIAIVATIIYFYKISKPAAYLLIPYILWVSFAAVLNYSLFVLN
jgi:tryptophan-rich sensory protein